MPGYLPAAFIYDLALDHGYDFGTIKRRPVGGFG